MTLVTRIHDLDGALVLNLNPAGGYRRETVGGHGVKWNRRTTSSLVVDGRFRGNAWTKDAQERTEVIKVLGVTWLQVEQRTAALEAAACEDDFLWVVGDGGVERTYLSVGPADSDSSFTREDRALNRRFVILSFLAQPNETVTFPEEP
jgi:hypothetical protein